ncbi:MAG: alanine--tRNA ligase, partial [Zetaproteobacteria bacterium]|nr:alanine--tRNA ligase [Zetaproteobacteria bacterium]
MEGSSQEHPFGIPFQTGAEIRSAFYRFFADRQHVHVPSSSVAQHDDPTLLFTNAGMNQFKAAFLGDNRQNWKRVYNSQKCMRVSGKHNDLDEVGADGTHHTFFEMLGNWSFGDYGKKEAIQWAWEFLTEHLKMPKNRLFATVHPEDHEAAQIWQQYTDIESWRILRFEQENFWEMGAVGPCGPSSEIFFDLGDAQTQDQTYNHPEQGVNGENPRYVEVWNLVFIQYERLQDRSLQPLPMLHVDTGSGLERLSMVVQGKQSNYDTDLFTQTLQEIEAKTGCRYPGNGLEGKPFRVICDHLRALSFAIADGVMPANEGRGYVMRRILRRACRYAHLLGQKAPFIYELVPTLVAKMRDAYPELGAREATIVETIRVEEERFLKTLDQGLGRFDKMVADARAAQAKVLDGAQAFLLHDTYGFPADLTQLLAEEQGFQVDQQGFDACMQEQRTRARAHAKFDDRFTSEEAWTILAPQKSTQFLGYEVTHVQEAKTLR